MQLIRKHLTYANVMATIAVFIALGGTVYAANKVSGKKIKTGSEPGNRLKKNSVTGKQVNELTLGQVPLAAHLGKVTVQTKDVGTIPGMGQGGATATCLPGQQAIAGGGLSDAGNNNLDMTDSRPVQGALGSPTDGQGFDGWRVFWVNGQGGGTVHPAVYVVCVG